MAASTPATSTSQPATHDPKVLWDSVGAAYETAFADLPAQQASLDWITSTLSSSGIKQATCLDIGCGTGRPVCQRLADAGHDVQGIDISEEMINAAKQRVPNASFEVADIKSWTPSQSYDVIAVYFSLISNVTQDEIRQTLQRIYEWLKPGGLFVFATVPVPANNAEIKWMGREIVVSGLGVEEFGQWFRKVGFEIVKEEESKFMPKGVEAGLTDKEEDVWEEGHLFIYARKR